MVYCALHEYNPTINSSQTTIVKKFNSIHNSNQNEDEKTLYIYNTSIRKAKYRRNGKYNWKTVSTHDLI